MDTPPPPSSAAKDTPAPSSPSPPTPWPPTAKNASSADAPNTSPSPPASPSCSPWPPVSSPTPSPPPPQKADAEDSGGQISGPPFLGNPPASVCRLKSLLEQQNLDHLQKIAHRLKGSGGLYGFDSITNTAAQLEAGLKQQQALEST